MPQSIPRRQGPSPTYTHLPGSNGHVSGEPRSSTTSPGNTGRADSSLVGECDHNGLRIPDHLWSTTEDIMCPAVAFEPHRSGNESPEFAHDSVGTSRSECTGTITPDNKDHDHDGIREAYHTSPGEVSQNNSFAHSEEFGRSLPLKTFHDSMSAEQKKRLLTDTPKLPDRPQNCSLTDWSNFATSPADEHDEVVLSPKLDLHLENQLNSHPLCKNAPLANKHAFNDPLERIHDRKRQDDGLHSYTDTDTQTKNSQFKNFIAPEIVKHQIQISDGNVPDSSTNEFCFQNDKNEQGKERRYKTGSQRMCSLSNSTISHSQPHALPTEQYTLQRQQSDATSDSTTATKRRRTDSILDNGQLRTNEDNMLCTKYDDKSLSESVAINTTNGNSDFTYHENVPFNIPSFDPVAMSLPPFLSTSFSKDVPTNRPTPSDHFYRERDHSIPSNSFDAMGNSLPPVLAAAAMAALTGGRLGVSSCVGQLNPLFASAEAAADMRRGSAKCLNSANLTTSLGDTLLSPMRVMYNTSKLLFGGCMTGRELMNTPPPPALSASNSPRIRSPRIASKSDACYGRLDNDADEEEEVVEEDVEEDEIESTGPEIKQGPEGSGTTSTGQQWTFEEQFKQLYVLSDDPKRKEFLDDLFTYMQQRGTPVNRIPIMAKQVLDLYELFQLVVARGGLVEVINKKLWREITKGLNLPSSITSAAFTLRTQYMKYLYPYECETLGLSEPTELQAAIDGNRREARRSSYSFDYPMMMGPAGSARNMSPTGLMGAHPSSSAMASAIPMGSMLSGPGLTSSTSFASASGLGSNLSSGLPHLQGVAMPFGTANNMSLNSQLNQIHPLLGIPPGSNPSLTLPQPSSFSHSQLASNPNHFFPQNLVNSISMSTSGLSLGSVGLSPFLSATSEDPLAKSPTTHAPACLLPGIPNSFAAAAATLFGAGFAPIPGAFTTGPPPTDTPPMTSASSDPINAQRPSPKCASKSKSPCALSIQRSQGRQSTCPEDEDADRSLTRSVSPLNLAASDDNPGSRSSKTTSMNLSKSGDDDSGLQEREAQVTPSPSDIASSDRHKELSPEDPKNSTRNSSRLGQKPSIYTGGNHKSHEQDIRERSNTGERKTEADHNTLYKNDSDTFKWAQPLLAAGHMQRGGIPFSGTNSFTSTECEELLNKTTTQASLWAPAGAMHNGVHNTDDTAASRTPNVTGSMVTETQNHKSNASSASVTTQSNKRQAGRVPSGGSEVTVSSTKVARSTTQTMSTNLDVYGKKVSGTSTHPSRKHTHPSVDHRRTGDMANSTAGATNVTHQNDVTAAMTTMTTQNLRIHTQSGAPMGLPPNAMVVTMELDNVLYQGVLFGQVMRR